MSPLALKHTGEYALILGGGPSLEKDLKRLGAGGIRIAVNHHASDLGIDSHYTVFNDKWTAENLKTSASKRVCRFPESADHLMAWPQAVLSARLAVWLARVMGCAPIILCGMDCNGLRRSETMTPEWYLDQWRWENPADIMAASGPMKKMFPLAPKRLVAAPRVKIFVEAGTIVQLDKSRSTSSLGGTYDLGAMGLAGACTDKIIKQPGVRVLTPKKGD